MSRGRARPQQLNRIRILFSNRGVLVIIAFRDRNAGSQNNRNRPTDGPSDRAQPAAHKNRDARGNMIREDRHSRTDRVYVLPLSLFMMVRW